MIAPLRATSPHRPTRRQLCTATARALLLIGWSNATTCPTKCPCEVHPTHNLHKKVCEGEKRGRFFEGHQNNSASLTKKEVGVFFTTQPPSNGLCFANHSLAALVAVTLAHTHADSGLAPSFNPTDQSFSRAVHGKNGMRCKAQSVFPPLHHHQKEATHSPRWCRRHPGRTGLDVWPPWV